MILFSLHKLYQQVRDCRQNKSGYEVLANVWHELQKNHPEDWLCALEILEILDQEDVMSAIAAEIQTTLETRAANEPEFTKLIRDGLKLIRQPV